MPRRKLNPLPSIAAVAVELVDDWLRAADAIATKEERTVVDRLAGVVADETGAAFPMWFVDRVLRPESDRVADAMESKFGGGRDCGHRTYPTNRRSSKLLITLD